MYPDAEPSDAVTEYRVSCAYHYTGPRDRNAWRRGKEGERVLWERRYGI